MVWKLTICHFHFLVSLKQCFKPLQKSCQWFEMVPISYKMKLFAKLWLFFCFLLINFYGLEKKKHKRNEVKPEIIYGIIQKVRSLKSFSFWSPPPPLVRSCSFYIYPPTPPPPNSTYVCFSQLPSSLKKSFATLMTLILNKKSGGEKREKNNFFVNST